MTNIKTISRSFVPLVAVFAMLLSLITPIFVSAAPVTTKSVQLSNASVSFPDTTYTVSFKAVQEAGAFVVDFCKNSPVIGTECEPPTDMNASAAESETLGFTDVTGGTSKVTVAGTIGAGATIAVNIDKIVNPSEAKTIYARIVTYDTKAHALLYQSETLGEGSRDEGSVAISITPTVGVSGRVLETLLFCVSGDVIGAGCTGVQPPVLKLGEPVGDEIALVPGELSDGTIHTQLTTNAVNGAVIRLKSSAEGCGGLLKAGTPDECYISPAQATGLNANDNSAKFGVMTSTATDTPSTTATGSLLPVEDSGYNNNTYALNYAANKLTGVTSTFGDPFLDTRNQPASNKNMALTFGVTVSTNTPSGVYAADLSLIATGKF
jgi:hypothetical protein